MTENHKRFLQHLEASEGGVWKAARWLHKQGLPVKVNVSGKAPSAEQWSKYTDQGDLEVSMRVEVKNLSADFTSRDDWPFGGDFIVCAKHAYDNARPKPYAFIYLNRARTTLAIVKGESRPRWVIKTRRDRRYENVEQEFYFALMDDVRFVTLAPDQEAP